MPGLRYDLQFLPDPIETDTDNFAPRMGIVYAPGDRKTVVRASFGLYYDRIPLRATSNALQRDGSKFLVVQLSPTQPGAPVFPNVLNSSACNAPDKTKHHAHRSEHRSELQPAGKSPDRT